MILKYAYRGLITFTSDISSHNFMLRISPFRSPGQKIIKEHTAIIPHCHVAKSVDSFGNIVHTGYIADRHDAFMFESTGRIRISTHDDASDLNRLFLYPSPLTMPDDILRGATPALRADGDIDAWIAELSASLKAQFAYQQGTTGVHTTAADAFRQGSGVCQDFAHIAITICRMNGIAARYVNGFMLGEGATHAWIEYYSNGVWRAFDPTNDRPVDGTYIKLAHGRDFNDCSTNRGTFSGNAQQEIRIALKVDQCREQ